MTPEERMEKILNTLSTVAELQLKQETELADIRQIQKTTVHALEALGVTVARTLDAVNVLAGIVQKHEERLDSYDK